MVHTAFGGSVHSTASTHVASSQMPGSIELTSCCSVAIVDLQNFINFNFNIINSAVPLAIMSTTAAGVKLTLLFTLK